MEVDPWNLYRQMLRSRLFEEIVKLLWDEGRISGEMHTSIGEEGIAAGVVTHLQEGDAMALDHRPIAPMIVRGIDPVLLLCEMLGREDGLCRGQGGHMHLFSQAHLAASSGIVGSSGPAAAGFALAAQTLRPGKIAVAFFGEGALNQGMMMEAMNLAVSWKLPLLFVCKNDQWAITTISKEVTGGGIAERARSFGMPAVAVDGLDVEKVWHAAEKLVVDARSGLGPAFILASCTRPDAHMLGDLLLRTARREALPAIKPMLGSAIGRGSTVRDRLRSIGTVTSLLRRADEEHRVDENDPLPTARRKLLGDFPRLWALEQEVKVEMEQVVAAALREPVGEGGPQ